jgi:hypothetical protein
MERVSSYIKLYQDSFCFVARGESLSLERPQTLISDRTDQAEPIIDVRLTVSNESGFPQWTKLRLSHVIQVPPRFRAKLPQFEQGGRVLSGSVGGTVVPLIDWRATGTTTPPDSPVVSPVPSGSRSTEPPVSG